MLIERKLHFKTRRSVVENTVIIADLLLFFTLIKSAMFRIEVYHKPNYLSIHQSSTTTIPATIEFCLKNENNVKYLITWTMFS